MGERLRERALLELPDLLPPVAERDEGFCNALRLDFVGELAGELLLRLEPTGEPPLCA